MRTAHPYPRLARQKSSTGRPGAGRHWRDEPGAGRGALRSRPICVLRTYPIIVGTKPGPGRAGERPEDGEGKPKRAPGRRGGLFAGTAGTMVSKQRAAKRRNGQTRPPKPERFRRSSPVGDQEAEPGDSHLLNRLRFPETRSRRTKALAPAEAGAGRHERHPARHPSARSTERDLWRAGAAARNKQRARSSVLRAPVERVIQYSIGWPDPRVYSLASPIHSPLHK